MRTVCWPGTRVRRPLCLAVGVFDGVHRGHQAIVSAAVKRAARSGAIPAALTFEPHPQAVLNPKGAPALLTPNEEKLALLRSMGIRLVVIARFDRKLAQTAAEEFVRDVLAGQLRAAIVVVGEDWRFGASGRGSPDLLRTMARCLGFQLRVVPSVAVRGEKVSSTRIRALVQQGRVAAACQLLGRPYQLAGEVVKGSGLGRQLGYPTANLQVPKEKLLPQDGIYACWAGQRTLWPAVAYIGVRPTIEPRGSRRMEVYLLERGRWVGLLGKRLHVELLARLRRDRRFPSAEALKAQMARDCSRARQILAALQE